MPSQFDELCVALNLNINQPSEDALMGFRDWYVEYVSQDKNRHEDLDSARDYLEIFMPNLPTNLADSVAAFEQMNAIQYAAAHGYDRFLDTLPASEAYLLNKAYQNGMTPLHFAAMSGHVHAVKSLLQHGADPRRKNNIGQFPIQSSLFTPMFVDENFYERKTIIFNALKIAAPETISGVDNQGQTVAHQMAINGYDTLIVDLIRENPTLFSRADNFMKYPIHLAILNDQLEVAQLLLQVPGSIELRDTNGSVALHYAAVSDNPRMLQACIPYYSTLNVCENHLKTPLLYAAELGNLSSVKVLIVHNADIYAKDMRGFSILHYAVKSSSEALVTFILRLGLIEVNDKDNSGHTALYYAKQENLAAICEILIEHGAVDCLSVSRPH